MSSNRRRYLYIEGYRYGLTAWARTAYLDLTRHQVSIGRVGVGWLVVWIGREQ